MDMPGYTCKLLLVNVRAVGLAGLAMLLLYGCGKREESAEPASDIRGAPIIAAPKTVTPTNVASTAPPPAATNNAPVATGGGYATVGFEQLSGYQIEISDELLSPQTNKTVLTADGQIP
jgi:hypothetical protein